MTPSRDWRSALAPSSRTGAPLTRCPCTNAGQIALYLVAAGGDEEPAEEAISAMLSSGGRLGVGWSLTRAGVSSGAWLVARKIAGAGTFLPPAPPPPRASRSTCTPLTPHFLHLQEPPLRAAAAVAWTWPP
jgi:hypothetical protein